MHSPILAPVAVLILWSLVMLVWLVVARIPELKRVGIDIRTARGGRPGALDGVVTEQAQWKAHNYIHLMEQPTLFYAACLALAVVGEGAGLNAGLAWCYVILRIGHSLVQVTVNVIRWRFLLFGLSTLMLIGLAVRLAMAVV